MEPGESAGSQEGTAEGSSATEQGWASPAQSFSGGPGVTHCAVLASQEPTANGAPLPQRMWLPGYVCAYVRQPAMSLSHGCLFLSLLLPLSFSSSYSLLKTNRKKYPRILKNEHSYYEMNKCVNMKFLPPFHDCFYHFLKVNMKNNTFQTALEKNIKVSHSKGRSAPGASPKSLHLLFAKLGPSRHMASAVLTERGAEGAERTVEK